MKEIPRFPIFTFVILVLLASPAIAGREMATSRAETEKAAAVKQSANYLSPREIAKYQETIQKLENYLSNLSTLQAGFVQSSSDGSVGEGTFYLQRPGKMRWEYAPPAPILIVSSGSDLVYFDKELEQITHIPIDDTLAGFLAQEHIVFDDQAVGIESISNEANAIRITISQRSKPEDGKLTLEFSDNPLQLRRMMVQDAAGGETTVSLTGAKFGHKLNPELFIFRDTRKKRTR
ncbi:MAG: outer membrane lipoprotein carrier protein LolA [Alphaproteobacteria bacterium]|nr:outer membrane lipoprotein carrier protein LolA [Alphaproteobacteria bacterium]